MSPWPQDFLVTPLYYNKFNLTHKYLREVYQLVYCTSNTKIKDLKTANKDRRKATKQGSRYCSVGIQFLSYKSLFWLYVCSHSYCYMNNIFGWVKIGICSLRIERQLNSIYCLVWLLFLRSLLVVFKSLI